MRRNVWNDNGLLHKNDGTHVHRLLGVGQMDRDVWVSPYRIHDISLGYKYAPTSTVARSHLVRV